MELPQLLKKHGIKRGMQAFVKKWYKNNKILLWIVIIITLLSVLPIFPSSSSETFRLDVPYVEGEYHSLDYGIGIMEDCDYFSPGSNVGIKITNKNSYPYGNNKPNSPRVITQKFKGYNISIFAMKVCGDCVNDSSLSILDQRSCLMNRSSIFGYFEQCKKRKLDNNQVTPNCVKIPFVISDNLQVISPDRSFKLQINPYVIKTKIKGEKYNPIINKYYVEMIITYPDRKPLPYAKWIGTALLFILDPLKSTLRYFTEKWFY